MYSDSNDLAKRTVSDKTWNDKIYEIARNCKYDGYQRALVRWSISFDEKTGSGVSVNKKLAEELHKAEIKKNK